MQKELITLLVASTAATSGIFAGTPRADLWTEAITAQIEKRPQDTISALNRVASLAADAKSWGEYALAAEMCAEANAEITGKARNITRISALREALAAAPSAESKIFLEAKLARAFLDLAQSFRAGTLRGNGDAEHSAEKLPKDIAEWSDSQLREAAAAHYENVLAQSERLKKIPLSAVKTPEILSDADWEKLAAFIARNSHEKMPDDAKRRLRETFTFDILTLNDASAAEFPTLYDFIARDAEKFFLELADSTFPRTKSNLPDSDLLLSSTQEFLDCVPASRTPNPDARCRALEILRERTRFHADNADRSALARVELDRIVFAQTNNAEIPEKKLEAALKKFIADYEYFPVSAEAAEVLARIYLENNRESEAHETAGKAVAAFGKTKNANGCKEILDRLEKSELTPIVFPGVWTSSIATPVSASAKNVKQIRFRAVPADWRDYLKKEHNRTNRLSQKEIAELSDAPDAVHWNLPLEQFHDFREHHYSLEIPAEKLAPGFYFVFIAPDNEPFEGNNAKNKSAPIPVWVGDIAVITEGGYQTAKLKDGGNVSVRVVNAVTGTPVEGATVSAWNKARWGGERISVAPVKTDAFGIANISGLKEDRDPLLLVEADFPAKSDALESGAGTQTHAVSLEAFSRSTAAKTPEDNGARIAIFPDRNVFRPGQKISFKGILARKEMPGNATAEVFPGKKVKIRLESNLSGKREILSETEAWTNGFGSFSGTLDIPREILLGNLSVSAESEGVLQSRCTVRVEEYRKPKSEIRISASEQPQILGGNASATIAGTSLTGAPLDGAKVRWTVCTYDFNERIQKEIASGEGALDATGTLKISWKTERRKLNGRNFSEQNLSPQELRERELDLGANFDISAEIVDSNGETVTASESVSVGNGSFNLVADYRRLCVGEDVPVTFRRSEKAQAPVSVKAEIFRVNEPEKLPRELRENPSARKEPELGEKVFSVETRTVSEKENTNSFVIPAGTLAPGRYRMIATCRDDFSQELRTENELIVLDAAAEKFPLKEAFLAQRKTPENANRSADGLHVGETAKFIWGSAIPGARAFVEISVGGKAFRSFYTEPHRTQQIIEVPITEEMDGKSVSVDISQMGFGKFYRNTFDFDVSPEKTLKIEPRRFDTKLDPGTPKIWTFKITRPDGAPAADTEILAGLYDISAENLLYRHAADSWQKQGKNFSPVFDRSFKNFFSSSNRQSRRYFSYPQTISQFSAFLLPEWTYTENHYSYAPAYFGARNYMRAAGATPETAAAPVPVAFKSTQAAQADTDAMLEEGVAENANSVPAGTSPFVFPLRKNLQETAFFYPFLQTDENGIVTMQFVAPEALTRWRLRIFAHDRQLRTGTFSDDRIFTSKDLMVQPDAPRFLREGDEIKFPVKITNRGNEEITGTLRLETEFLAADGKKIPASGESDASQNFTVPAQASATLFREIRVPPGAVAMKFRALGSSGKISDGESAALPVLPREVVITESRTALVRPGAEAELTFEKLAGKETTSADAPRSRALVLDSPKSAYDAALLALPYIAEQTQECESSDSIFYRFYTNALAREICASAPQLQEKFELWRTADPEKLDSPLRATGENSPYAGIAQSESEQRRAVGAFFEPNKIDSEIRRALATLRERLNENNGQGWSWFPNSRYGANPHITREILLGLGRLRERISDENLRGEIDRLARAPLEAQDAWLQACFNGENAECPARIDGATLAQFLYMRTLFAAEATFPQTAPEAWAHYLAEAQKADFWTKLSRMSQAQTALALWRSGEKSVAKKIIESLRQRALRDERLGMYWNDLPTLPLWLPQYSPIETQAAMIEAFSEIDGDENAVGEMKIHLLTRKQTHAWKSSRASANALFALLRENGNAAATETGSAVPAKVFAPANIKFSGADAQTLAPGAQTVSPESAKITAKNEGDAPGFVSAHWTYSLPLSAVTADAPANGFSVKKTVFKRERTHHGKYKLVPARLEILNPGDEIVVRLTVRADRDFEFVCLKDFRASGCEPAEPLSGWKNNNLLWYYGEPRDAETRFYFDRLPAGTHVFEYAQRVRTSGLYSSGFAEIRSLYAPEFSAHSSSESLVSR